ncbi:MAG: 3-oxoacyl-[acyl-carrier protein] reductase [Actinomycetia bacterium]|nr:3-oxoacyl-[acyl-carrier protein] reductase [Actinomycetes bacterium]
MGALDGRVAIVTGSGGGIGRGEAMFLAAEGAKVVVNDVGPAPEGANRTPAEQVVAEIVAAGGEASANRDDISTFAGAEALVDQAVGTYGDLNILVNNAGIVRDAMSFSMTEAEWDAVLAVHLKGHFAPARFASRYWRERSKSGADVYGRIINTSSESGLHGQAGQANYSAAKAGIASMSIVQARELQKYGITVNAIAPRGRTAMTLAVPGAADIISAKDGEFDGWHPDNVAPFVGFLASPAAAGISGQVFVVWGDEVIRMTGWMPATSIRNGDRWTIDEIVARQADLFPGEHDTEIPLLRPTL